MRGTDWSRSLWRRMLLAFTLLAFVQAGYVTQTHIHIPVAPASAAVLGHAGLGKAPVDDPEHCPLCQQYLISGAYLTPQPIVVPAPVSLANGVLSVVCVLGFVATLSHSWHGRAPPLV